MSAIEADEDVAAITARTALQYDSLPYQSKAFAESQPSRLGAIARLFGLEAAPLAAARVLELGCASGGNIFPLASRYPEAMFVGIDLSPAQVAAGQARIAELGLSNIEIRCQSITDLGEDLGSFDYILCHGVFSWVPHAVQEAIFRTIGAHLSPVGVACISFNVLPGWRMLQPLRDAFQLQVPDDPDPLARVAAARELLAFLDGATSDQGPYGQILRNWAARLSTLPAHYIAHEFLEEMNHPSTIRAFADRAVRHGLAFLGECDIPPMILDNYGEDLAQQIRARTRNDPVEIEQHIDLLSGRTFRSSILVTGARQAAVDRVLEPESVAGLHFLIQARMRIERIDDRHVVTDAMGRTLTTTSDGVAAGLARMIARFPSSSTLHDCAGDDPAERDGILSALYRMVIVGMVVPLSEPAEAGRPGDRPVAFAHARADAADGSDTTTNVRHETVALDPAIRLLLPMLDGTRDHAALADELADEAIAGRLTFQREGRPVTDAGDIRQAATDALPLLLTTVADLALLAPAG